MNAAVSASAIATATPVAFAVTSIASEHDPIFAAIEAHRATLAQEKHAIDQYEVAEARFWAMGEVHNRPWTPLPIEISPNDIPVKDANAPDEVWFEALKGLKFQRCYDANDIDEALATLRDIDDDKRAGLREKACQNLRDATAKHLRAKRSSG